MYVLPYLVYSCARISFFSSKREGEYSVTSQTAPLMVGGGSIITGAIRIIYRRYFYDSTVLFYNPGRLVAAL